MLAPSIQFACTQSASAGTYTVSTCSPTSSAGGWQPVDTFPTGLIVGNMCGGPASGPNEPQGPTDEGALFAQDSTNTTADIPGGAEAGWSFTAPAGTNIASITYWRSLHSYNQQSLVPGLWTSEGTALESCQAPPEGTHECNSLNNQGSKTFADLHTGSLFFGVRCNLVGGSEYCVPAAPGERHAQADLYSASVTVSETASPTVSSISGAGWSGGYLSGEVPITLSASDPSGIAGLEVRSSSGAVLASSPQQCDYYSAVPCPGLSGTTIKLNTAAALDGPQSLVLTVTDAAGNATSTTSPPVTVDNHGPAAPTGLTATLAGKEVTLSWTDPPTPPAPIASATVTLCSTVCLPSSTVSASGPVRVPAPSTPGTYTVQLSLTDAASKTSAPATTTFTVPVSSPPPSKSRFEAIIDSRGRLYVAGLVPKRLSPVWVCWHSKRGRRTLGSRCVRLYGRHGRVAVTFHLSGRARRGRVTVTVAHGSRTLARLVAVKTHPAG